MKPATKPNRPFFSSGPCSNRPGWSLDSLSHALVGLSHRTKPAQERIHEALDTSATLPCLP